MERGVLRGGVACVTDWGWLGWWRPWGCCVVRPLGGKQLSSSGGWAGGHGWGRAGMAGAVEGARVSRDFRPPVPERRVWAAPARPAPLAPQYDWTGSTGPPVTAGWMN